LAGGVFLALNGTAPVAQAEIITLAYDASNAFRGDVAFPGSITADITDVTGGVQLVITSNLATGEYVETHSSASGAEGFFFNFDPALSAILPDLTFTLKSTIGAFTQAATTLVGENKFEADGVGGLYDINMTWAKGQGFSDGESQTYLITTSHGSIDAADFDYLSTDAPNALTAHNWVAAAQIGGIAAAPHQSWVGADVASIVGVPESSTWAMMVIGFGLVGLQLRRRRTAPSA
jgi:hypothetical protein